MLDLNALNDMSILAVNTTYPDKTEENIDILTNFSIMILFSNRLF